MTRVTITALLAAVVTGGIAGVAFWAAGVPRPGAVMLGAVVALVLGIVQAALWWASRPQPQGHDRPGTGRRDGHDR
jgi:hypothetical protein